VDSSRRPFLQLQQSQAATNVVGAFVVPSFSPLSLSTTRHPVSRSLHTTPYHSIFCAASNPARGVFICQSSLGSGSITWSTFWHLARRSRWCDGLELHLSPRRRV